MFVRGPFIIGCRHLVGGAAPGGGRRHIGKTALVVVAAEVRGPAIGRIRLRRVADSSRRACCRSSKRPSPRAPS
jgi:hypothetical protein